MRGSVETNLMEYELQIVSPAKVKWQGDFN